MLLDQVKEFAHTRGLTKILPLLRKGALVARDPTNYEDITGAEALNDLEIEALRDEVLHKWRQPLALYLTIITCSVGASVQGWDQTGLFRSFLSFSEKLPDKVQYRLEWSEFDLPKIFRYWKHIYSRLIPRRPDQRGSLYWLSSHRVLVLRPCQ